MRFRADAVFAMISILCASVWVVYAWVRITREPQQREAGFLTGVAAQVKQAKTVKMCPPEHWLGRKPAQAINLDIPRRPTGRSRAEHRGMNFFDGRALEAPATQHKSVSSRSANWSQRGRHIGNGPTTSPRTPRGTAARFIRNASYSTMVRDGRNV